MSISDELLLKMRVVGARNAARDVDATNKAVDRTGKASRKSAKETSLLGKSTGLLLKPFHHLREEAFGLAKGVAAAGIAFGSVEGIKKSIETTDTLVKTTVKLRTQFGLSTEAASGLGAVLQARDLQPQALTMGLTGLSKQLIAAEHGSKNAQGAFRIFGIRARDVHAAIGSRDGLSSVFQTVVDQLSQMPGGARKAAVSQQLLGRASKGLAPLLQEGALGLKQQLKWAKEYGVTLDDHTIGSVEGMAAAQTQAQYAMLGLQIQIGRFAAPLVTKANLALADIVKSFRDGRPEGTKFSKTVYQLGVDLKPVGHDLAVVGGYLKDHPHLLQAAGVAYIGYRTKLLKLITIAPLAYGKGLIAGRSYAAGFETGSLTGAGRGSLLAAGRGAGRLMGTAMVAAVGVELGLGIGNWLKKHHVPDWLAKKITGIDPKKTAADERKNTRNLRRDTAKLTDVGRTGHVYNPATRKMEPVKGTRVTPKINLNDVVAGHPAPAGGDIVVHAHLYLTKDGKKEIAKTVHRQAIEKKSTG